jgi:16S rRNA (uracil1498-N3)-methyltransferase
MDVIIEKASELGVARLIPLALERCVARPHEAGAKQERWHRLAVASLKQAKRARLMEIEAPASLDRFLDDLDPRTTIWAADPRGVEPSRAAGKTGPGPVALVVGPEGGLSPREGELLQDRGALWVGLGGHRLRAETAAVTLLVSALSALGQLGGAPEPPTQAIRD